MERTFIPATLPLIGQVLVPGDKSLSHRAVLFSAMAEGVSRVSGVLDSQDVRSTISAVSALGAEVDLVTERDGSLSGTICGWGRGGPHQPAHAIDCGNSGTTARLLLGVIAGWPIEVTLTGDDSLSRRPMRRVTEPLSMMGAQFQSTSEYTLPITVRGRDGLRPLSYQSPVASAQVKTAVLLAGLRAEGGVRVSEPAHSRNHTELLLPAFGVELTSDPAMHSASLCGPQVMKATSVRVPRDPSSAAFFVAAALLVPGSEITLPEVSLNPTRTRFLEVLRRMGADIGIGSGESAGAEPSGTIVIRHTGSLAATNVTPEEVPGLVDEVPVLALVSTQARGTTRFTGIGELRVKESDRLAAVADGLTRLGAEVAVGEDWLEVTGPTPLTGGVLESMHDHRLAMCWALAGLAASSPVLVRDFEAVSVSYPRFAEDLASLSS